MNKKEKVTGIIAILVISSIALIFGYYSQNRKEEVYTEVFHTEDKGKENEVNKEEVVSEPVLTDKTIVVDIKGAVKEPRDYKLKEGSRIRDLIEMAGGLTEEADEERIYYSKILNDQECVKIYKIGEEASQENNEEETITGNSSIDSKGVVNINKASKEELKTLPGIGDVKAESILEYRDTKGKFNSIEELGNIEGIGGKTVDKLRDKVDIK